jgi:histone deacetylase 1/2
MKSPNKDHWIKASNNEFVSLLGMQTWDLVPRLVKQRVIKSKWVFNVKRNPDHTIHKLKARLVAMGYSQIHGVDYDKVFSPMLRLETLRLIYSLMASKSWTGQQVDFKTAFLNGNIDKPIFMEQPPGFEDPQRPDYVCKINRLLYGLKQAPRQWNLKLHNGLISLGLSQLAHNPTLYFQVVNNKLIGAISVHVDDLLIVGKDPWVVSVISALGKQFTIGADNELHHFLSLKITRDFDQRLVFLSQAHYIEELQNLFIPNSHVSVPTPTSSTFKDLCRCVPSEEVSPGPYLQLIGCLLWISQCKSPDTAFAVNRLSQFLCNPSIHHWNAAIQVLHYLVSTKDLWLRLGGSLDVAGYSNSNWAEDREDRKSTSGYTYRVGSGAISWKSGKQATVSLSSTEVEYKALSDSCKEGVWLRLSACYYDRANLTQVT